MTTITNAAGTTIDYEAAVELMKPHIREYLHGLLAPCSEAEFFAAYCVEHFARYDEIFEPNKRNPVW